MSFSQIADNQGAGLVVPPLGARDLSGRVKVTQHQNIYEADFEYGLQPLRWEQVTANNGSITHLPAVGGVRMRVTTTSGDLTIRQSRAYHRYQPGKTMAMASAACHVWPRPTNRPPSTRALRSTAAVAASRHRLRNDMPERYERGRFASIGQTA